VDGRYARNLTFAQFVKGVGSVGSTALVAWLAVGEMGWRRAFPVFLALTVVGLVTVTLLKVQETRSDEPPSIASSLALLKEPAFAFAVLGIFLYVGAEVGLSTWLGPRLEALGLPGDRAKFLGPTLFLASLTVGRLLGSGVLSLVPARAFFRISAALGVLGLLAVLSGVAPLAVAGVVACGLGFANIWPVLFSLTVEERPQRSAELSGLMCMAIFGGAVLPPLMGKLKDVVGMGPAFLVPLAAFAYLVVLSLTSAGNARAREA
jgi:FHS family L-fucose permease-like MFS transporter